MGSEAPEQGARQAGTLTERAGLVALGTLGSRLLGAVRDAVIAASFALGATDAFFVAWTIPNTLRRVLGEGAVSAAFIPLFSEADEQDGREAARRYFARFFGALLLLLLAVSAVGAATAPLWATVYAAGYRHDPTKFATTVELTALVFPYILFAGVAALLSGALNALGRFLLPSFSPALLNLSLIAAPIAFVPIAIQLGLSPVAGLAIGALVGGAMQVLVQLPSLRREGMPALPSFALRDARVRQSLLLMAPLLLGTGVHQINILLSRLFASYLPTGAQSYLYYGQRLVEIPQGMFAMAVASAALPSLARLRSQEKHEEARDALRYSVQLSLFVAIPAAVALAVLAEPTVTVIFGRGAFAHGAVVQTARSLVWLAAGVWAVAISHALTRMYYAYNDTRTPVWCAAANLVTFVALSAKLGFSLGHVGLAIATTGAAMVQLLLLALLLRRRTGPLGWGPILKAGLRCGVAGAVMALVVHDLATLGDWSRGGNDTWNLGIYAFTALFGLAVYAAASYLLRSPELTQIAGALSRRWRAPQSP